MRPRWIALILIYAGLLVGGWLAGTWMDSAVLIDVLPQNEVRVHRMLMIALVVYVVASAIPFVPGAEIGLTLLVLFGAKAAPLVYAGMVGALLLGFLLGRFVPLRTTARAASVLGFARTHDLLDGMAQRDPGECLAFLTTEAPRRIVPWLLRYRHIAIAVLLNLPGNSAVGGGGGIAFVAGTSRLFSFPAYAATIAVAVAPIPLYVVLVGQIT